MRYVDAPSLCMSVPQSTGTWRKNGYIAAGSRALLEFLSAKSREETLCVRQQNWPWVKGKTYPQVRIYFF